MVSHKPPKRSLVRWQEYYATKLNHPPATACPDLDQDAASASEAADVCSDAPSLQEIRDAIARLKNERAAGPDGIPPELLKCASEPIANALHSLILMVWREAKVLAAWRNGIITALYRGKGSKADCGNYRQSRCCLCLGKSSRMRSLRSSSPCY